MLNLMFIALIYCNVMCVTMMVTVSETISSPSSCVFFRNVTIFFCDL